MEDYKKLHFEPKHCKMTACLIFDYSYMCSRLIMCRFSVQLNEYWETAAWLTSLPKAQLLRSSESKMNQIGLSLELDRIRRKEGEMVDIMLCKCRAVLLDPQWSSAQEQEEHEMQREQKRARKGLRDRRKAEWGGSLKARKGKGKIGEARLRWCDKNCREGCWDEDEDWLFKEWQKSDGKAGWEMESEAKEVSSGCQPRGSASCCNHGIATGCYGNQHEQ